MIFFLVKKIACLSVMHTQLLCSWPFQLQPVTAHWQCKVTCPFATSLYSYHVPSCMWLLRQPCRSLVRWHTKQRFTLVSEQYCYRQQEQSDACPCCVAPLATAISFQLFNNCKVSIYFMFLMRVELIEMYACCLIRTRKTETNGRWKHDVTFAMANISRADLSSFWSL
jgi:hypothetical protein